MIIRKVVKHALGDGGYYWLELACGHEKTTRGLPTQTRCRICEQDIGVQIADETRRSRVDNELQNLSIQGKRSRDRFAARRDQDNGNDTTGSS